MNALALLLAAQTAVGGDTMPPYVVFPMAGLDDSAAYAGYATRIYRDARGNAIQISIEASSGRVVHLWADALNESLGFTARDTTGVPARLVYGGAATTTATTSRRTFSSRFTTPGPVQLGLFLLGSMRVERDFQYAGRQRDSLGATFVVPELTRLTEAIDRLPSMERRRALALLGARDGAALRSRLVPRLTVTRGATAWSVRAEQPSFDGNHRLALTVSGDARRSQATLAGRVVTFRPLDPGAGPLELTVEIATDGPALTPLARAAIFNDAFRRFADSHGTPRLERQIRGFELLASREKLMAGLPNFATYFGRDMLMTALLMEPVWSDTMAEYVIAAALTKLAPTGEVSHEEALGGQAIRENAARYLDHPTPDAAILGNLQEVRENYWMVDDDFQLPVVAARYVANAAVPEARKRRFLRLWREPLHRNLAYVVRQATPYVLNPIATNLVSFRRLDDGWWHAGSWRDSRVGYAGGRFAFDVNVVWVPAALRAIGTIDSVLRLMGEPELPEAAAAARAAAVWRGVDHHFAVALAPAEVEARIRARLAALRGEERAHWQRVLARTSVPTDTLRFPALSLDADGHPIHVMSTDPAMWLLLANLGPEREAELLRPFLLPYPVGLLIDGVGPVAANDAYAPPAAWDMFERDRYHSPRVVWGREVNVLVSVLALRGLRPALDTVLAAVERSGLRHAELWSYQMAGETLRPVRYGSSSDVQLWNLTDLAVQFLLAQLPAPAIH